MRDDMARVTVERPRIPDHGVRRKSRALPLDQLPANEGMRRPHVRFWGGKELNENLAPLGVIQRPRLHSGPIGTIF